MITDTNPPVIIAFVLPKDWKKPKFKVTQEVNGGVITGMTYIKHRTFNGQLQNEWQYEVTYSGDLLPESYSEEELIRMVLENALKQA